MIRPNEEVIYINMSEARHKATVLRVMDNGSVNVMAQSPSNMRTVLNEALRDMNYDNVAQIPTEKMNAGYRPYLVTDVKIFAHDDPAPRPKRDYCETIPTTG